MIIARLRGGAGAGYSAAIGLKVKVPEGTENLYKADPVWSRFKDLESGDGGVTGLDVPAGSAVAIVSADNQERLPHRSDRIRHPSTGQWNSREAAGSLLQTHSRGSGHSVGRRLPESDWIE